MSYFCSGLTRANTTLLFKALTFWAGGNCCQAVPVIAWLERLMRPISLATAIATSRLSPVRILILTPKDLAFLTAALVLVLMGSTKEITPKKLKLFARAKFLISLIVNPASDWLAIARVRLPSRPSLATQSMIFCRSLLVKF